MSEFGALLKTLEQVRGFHTDYSTGFLRRDAKLKGTLEGDIHTLLDLPHELVDILKY